MIDGPDEEDGSDWLSSQFEPTAQVPAQVPAQPAVPPPVQHTPPPTSPPAQAFVPPRVAAPSPVPTVAAPPPAAAAPPPVAAVPVPVSAAPAPPSPATLPGAAAPAPNAGGGFDWGLKPRGSVAPPSAAPPVVPSPVAHPPVAPPVAPPVVPPVVPPIVLSIVAVPPPSASVAPAPPRQAPAPAPAVQTPLQSAPPPLVDPPTAPSVAPPAQTPAAEPTKPLSWDAFAATQQQDAPSPQTSVDQPTEAYTVLPWQPAASPVPVAHEQLPTEPDDPTSAIDSLFGDHKFQDYEEVGVLKTIQVPPPAGVVEPELREPREPLSRLQKVLMSVAGVLIAALILVGLFFFGQHLGAAAAAAPTPAGTSTASATPTPAGTSGPVAPGVQQWNALQGGECIQPFSTAWALTFTVVACTADHDAEMVFKGKLPDSTQAKYPSATGFQKEITPLCSASTAINYAAAAGVTDLQVSFSYPPTTAAWLSDDRTYYCFVDRVSGGNLPGDLAVPKTP